MVIERGLMTKICEFKTNSRPQKGAGTGNSYSTLLSCRGYLKQQSGTRTLNNGDVEFDTSFTLITDFIQSLFNSIEADLKVLIDGITYTVDAWEKIDQKRFYLKFNLSVSE